MKNAASKSESLTIDNEILLGTVTEILSEGREVVLMTKGSSMLPFIRGERDSVVLKKFDSASVGDVVLAHLGCGHYVLHRVIAVDGERLTLMGDGNLFGTESCTQADVSGTAVEIIRPGGKRIEVTDKIWWRKLLPVRRWILAIYRRTWYRF